MPMLMTLRMRLPVWPFQVAAADPVGEVRHLVEHGVDLGHHVLAVDDDRCPSRRAQGHVQHGAVLGDVDLLAAEHGVDPRAQAGFLRQLQEQLEGFVGDAILRVVEEDPTASAVIRSPRPGSSAKSLRRCSSRTF